MTIVLTGKMYTCIYLPFYKMSMNEKWKENELRLLSRSPTVSVLQPRSIRCHVRSDD